MQPYALICTGLVAASAFLVLALSWPYIFFAVLQQALMLSPGSVIYDVWIDSPVGISMDIYLWNWTNAEEFVANKSIRPKFEEVGPFVFNIRTRRVNVTWNDNFTVTYVPERTFTFVYEESLDLNETQITSVSPVAAVLAYYSRFWDDSLFAKLINRELELREQIWHTASAGNWLFYGINDSFLDLIVPLREVIDLPLPYDKFAWFYGRNQSDTAEGTFTIYTGVKDLYKVGRMQLWKGQEQTEFYDGECGRINGFTGELFPPIGNQKNNVSVFAADICSNMHLQYSGETTVSGVTGYHFTGSDDTFDDGNIYFETKCYCSGVCVPSGARNISVCKFGAPAFISFPHFLMADETYSKRIDGMVPNESIHQFTLDVEPTTGIPLSVKAQLQINLLMQSSTTMDMFKDMPEIYFPVMWFRQRASIDADLGQMVNFILIVPTIGYGIFYGLVGLGVLFIIVGVLLHRRSNPGTTLEKSHEVKF